MNKVQLCHILVRWPRKVPDLSELPFPRHKCLPKTANSTAECLACNRYSRNIGLAPFPQHPHLLLPQRTCPEVKQHWPPWTAEGQVQHQSQKTPPTSFYPAFQEISVDSITLLSLIIQSHRTQWRELTETAKSLQGQYALPTREIPKGHGGWEQITWGSCELVIIPRNAVKIFSPWKERSKILLGYF